jgi:hypothetical protein
MRTEDIREINKMNLIVSLQTLAATGGFDALDAIVLSDVHINKKLNVLNLHKKIEIPRKKIVESQKRLIDKNLIHSGQINFRKIGKICVKKFGTFFNDPLKANIGIEYLLQCCCRFGLLVQPPLFYALKNSPLGPVINLMNIGTPGPRDLLWCVSMEELTRYDHEKDKINWAVLGTKNFVSYRHHKELRGSLGYNFDFSVFNPSDLFVIFVPQKSIWAVLGATKSVTQCNQKQLPGSLGYNFNFFRCAASNVNEQIQVVINQKEQQKAAQFFGMSQPKEIRVGVLEGSLFKNINNIIYGPSLIGTINNTLLYNICTFRAKSIASLAHQEETSASEAGRQGTLRVSLRERHVLSKAILHGTSPVCRPALARFSSSSEDKKFKEETNTMSDSINGATPDNAMCLFPPDAPVKKEVEKEKEVVIELTGKLETIWKKIYSKRRTGGVHISDLKDLTEEIDGIRKAFMTDSQYRPMLPYYLAGEFYFNYKHCTKHDYKMKPFAHVLDVMNKIINKLVDLYGDEYQLISHNSWEILKAFYGSEFRERYTRIDFAPESILKNFDWFLQYYTRDTSGGY